MIDLLGWPFARRSAVQPRAWFNGEAKLNFGDET